MINKFVFDPRYKIWQETYKRAIDGEIIPSYLFVSLYEFCLDTNADMEIYHRTTVSAINELRQHIEKQDINILGLTNKVNSYTVKNQNLQEENKWLIEQRDRLQITNSKLREENNQLFKENRKIEQLKIDNSDLAYFLKCANELNTAKELHIIALELCLKIAQSAIDELRQIQLSQEGDTL